MRALWCVALIGVWLCLSACGGDAKEPAFKTSAELLGIVHAASQIDIQYGDGNALAVATKDEIRHLTSALDSMKFAPVDGPDGVGQNFVLQAGDGDDSVKYYSTGYFVYRGQYYRIDNVDAIKQLNAAVVDYGNKRIPGLLGSK